MGDFFRIYFLFQPPGKIFEEGAYVISCAWEQDAADTCQTKSLN